MDSTIWSPEYSTGYRQKKRQKWTIGKGDAALNAHADSSASAEEKLLEAICYP
jgi:hypothetical protein